MAKRSKHAGRRKTTAGVGSLARAARSALRSYTVGALPILNQVLDRLRLEDHLRAYLPAEDGRTKPSTPRTLLVLLRNLLVSREPLYGIGEWAARHAPDLLGLTRAEVARLNDDRVGRALDRLFLADVSSLALAGRPPRPVTCAGSAHAWSCVMKSTWPAWPRPPPATGSSRW